MKIQKIKQKIAFIAVALGLVTNVSQGHATSLQQQIKQLSAQQKVLEQKLNEQQHNKKDSAVVVANQEGFALKSTDGHFLLKLRGLIQADGRLLCRHA